MKVPAANGAAAPTAKTLRGSSQPSAKRYFGAEVGSSSFLKKRTKKLLRGCRGLVGDSRVKGFASFFKKQRFSFRL
jgi:hypothetical protein